MAKTTARVKKPVTKTEIITYLAEANDLTRAETRNIIESLEKLIRRELGRRGPGIFNFAGLFKISVVKKPATKSRPGRNPFTGEEITIKAKPARRTVKITALKKLKEMI